MNVLHKKGRHHKCGSGEGESQKRGAVLANSTLRSTSKAQLQKKHEIKMSLLPKVNGVSLKLDGNDCSRMKGEEDKKETKGKSLGLPQE